MSLKNWSTTAASNTALPPDGAPESSTKFKDWNDIMRQVMAKVRCLAAPVTIASAATTDLGASDETIQTISGTTTITSFGTVSAGIWKLVTFSGALTLTHNATSLILLTGANRTTAAGDCGLYVSLGGGNWKEYFYSATGTPASYQPLDDTLTALAALNATAGVVEQTGADTFTKRTIGTSSGNIPVVGTSSATEVLAGLVELATGVEALGGSDTARAVTSAGLASAKSLAANGYMKLPGGLIMQWGSAVTTSGAWATVTYPTAFTSVAHPVGWADGYRKISFYQNSALTGFDVRAYDEGAGAETVSTVQWMAFGY